MAGGIYTSMSGAMADMTRLDVLSNNLANVSTPGYKQDGVVFGEVLASQVHRQVEVSGEYTDHTQGPFKATGRKLDLSMTRAGTFFTVKTPSGQRLTRSGKVYVTADGTLVDEKGRPFMGVDKPVIKIDNPTADVYITEDGNVMVGDAKVDSLLMQVASSPGRLRKEGNDLFAPTAAAGVRRAKPGEIQLMSGYLEGSNVDAVSSMVQLITLERHFELNTKAIEAYASMDKLAAEQVGSTK